MAWSKRVVKSRSRKMSGRKRVRSINSRRKLIGGRCSGKCRGNCGNNCTCGGGYAKYRARGGGGCAARRLDAHQEDNLSGGRRRVKRSKRSKRSKNRRN